MSLKDALMKAGLKSSKSENERDLVAKKKEKKIEAHQKARNFCEVCEFIQPDVERFKHNNPTVDAEWICAACADKEMIQDKFRMTHQSDFAIQNRYRREFGATQNFSQTTRSNFKNKNKKNNSEKEANFNVSDDGEKNFNC